jgi:sulfide:quinone oxidoreductase
MKRLAIVGAGTGGTLLANRMRKRLGDDWSIAIIDPEDTHLYQPGLLFLPFGRINEKNIVRPRGRTLSDALDWIHAPVEAIDPAKRTITLEGGDRLAYDFLVLASGSRIRPDLTEGLLGEGWRQSAFDFYTLEGALALREALSRFEKGRLVLNVVEMPIKCPVAPLEFLFLADDYFKRGGIRDQIELVYATPLDGAFTKPLASKLLGHLLEEKGIRLETEFAAGEVDGARRILRSYDEREIPYDLLVTVPTHSGAEFVEASGLGNELAFVPTDPATLEAKGQGRIFVMGDATDLPTSKAGSVAHFQGELLAENLERAIAGEAALPTFDGHANCFVETGGGKAILIDFNYGTEPLPGRFPVAGLGPMTLLKESRRNHWGKLAFRWVYWNMLLPGRSLPVPARMSMSGKVLPNPAAAS